MFSSAKFLALVGLIPFILAAPAAELSTRAATIDTSSHCGTSTSLALTRKSNTNTHISGQWDSVAAGQYSLILDQWGLSGASSGSDCAQLTTLSGTTVAWKTTWTWTGGSGVKSFTNMQLDSGLNKQLSAIKSIPVRPFLSVFLHDQVLIGVYPSHFKATWNWSQSSSGTVVADVAYDLFTSSTSGGSNVNEIMIWLANFNAGPISAVYNSNGTPQPIASGISLAGHTWFVLKHKIALQSQYV
jgi:xyloglucan-specific endo-beta-1,4-glucanase